MPHDPTAETAAKLDLVRVQLLHIVSEANDEWCESHSWQDIDETKRDRYIAWLRVVESKLNGWDTTLGQLARKRPRD